MHVRKDIERYFLDDLSPRRVARMRRHLENCRSCRDVYDEQVRLLRALHGDAESPGADELERLTDRVQQSLGLFPETADPAVPVGHWAWAFAGASVLALGMFLFVWLAGDGPGPVEKEAPWQQVASQASTTLELKAGTRVKLEGGSRYRIRSAGQVLELAQGKASCRVQPKTGGFSVRTPEARVVVVGTAFIVDRIHEARTEVRVLRGKVQVAGQKGEAVLVAAGHRCVVKAGVAAGAVKNMPVAQQRSEWEWFWNRLGRDISQAAEDIGDMVFGD